MAEARPMVSAKGLAIQRTGWHRIQWQCHRVSLPFIDELIRFLNNLFFSSYVEST